MNLDSKITWLVLFAGVFFLSAVVSVFARWCLFSAAVPYNRLNRLRVGMTMREVRELLGEPRREGVHQELPEWLYGHRLKRHVLLVHFDEDGMVRQFQHAAGKAPRQRDVPDHPNWR